MPDSSKTPIGGLVLAKGDIDINAGLSETVIKVRNTGDRPVQVGSHFHFFEVNASLEFDRKAAFGKRLNIPATTALRFEPGDEKEVRLICIQGKQRMRGFNNLVDGWVGDESTRSSRPRLNQAMEKVALYGFKNKA